MSKDHIRQQIKKIRVVDQFQAAIKNGRDH